MRKISVLSVAAVAAIVSFTITSTTQAADPAVKCEAGKLKEAGKYANCRMKADSKAVRRNEPPDYSKCLSKFADKWGNTETKAEGACPSNGDEVAVEAAITTCMADVATSLRGCVTVGGACWDLGALGDSCDDTCNALGLAYDDATRTYAGADGTLANCTAVLDAIGAVGGVPFDVPFCADGVGCVKDIFDNRGRCTDGVTNSSASSAELFRACACMLTP